MNTISVAQSNSWCFTLNNYTPTDVEKLLALDGNVDIPHIIFGREVGDNGTPHLQGYIRFAKKKRIGGVKRIVGDNAHVEVARNPVAAIQYCKKDGDFTEIGGWESQQGQRSDLQEIIDLVYEGHIEPLWWITNHPDKWSARKEFIKDCIVNIPRTVTFKRHPLRKWQAGLWKFLSYKPDDRHILFVVDRTGNCGKSYFCRYYKSVYPDTTQIFSPAKGADLAHAYKTTNRVVFFDVPRSRCDSQLFPYNFLEGVKNGSVFCSKYESREKEFDPAHLVVFMNEMPLLDKLSVDRYLIRILTAKDNEVSGPLVNTDFVDQFLPRHMLWKDHHGRRVDETQDEQFEQVGVLDDMNLGGDMVGRDISLRGAELVEASSVSTVAMAPRLRVALEGESDGNVSDDEEMVIVRDETKTDED